MNLKSFVIQMSVSELIIPPVSGFVVGVISNRYRPFSLPCLFLQDSSRMEREKFFFTVLLWLLITAILIKSGAEKYAASKLRSIGFSQTNNNRQRSHKSRKGTRKKGTHKKKIIKLI